MTEDRRTWLGGSDVAAVLGISPWKTAIDLWLEKTAPEPLPQVESPQMRRGKRKERYILEWAAEDYGLKVYAINRRVTDTTLAFLRAEIDAEDCDGNNIEIKTVSPFMADEWGDPDTDAIPIHYTAQVQHGLGVTSRKRCFVFAEIGDEIWRYVVERDDALIEHMRQECAKFWGCVQNRARPAIDYDRPSSALSVVRKLYPGTDGGTLMADDDALAWRAVYESSIDSIKRYQAVADGAKAHLLESMGEAAELQFGDGMMFRRKVISRKEVTIVQPACSYVDFRLAKQTS